MRRRSSIGNRHTLSVDSQQGKQRATMSRRNLSLDSELENWANSVTDSREQRRNSLSAGGGGGGNTDSQTPPQRERPKYSRQISSASMVESTNSNSQFNGYFSNDPTTTTTNVHQQEPWMEGKTPRTTGRRRSIGVTTSRRISLTGGMNYAHNPLDKSDSTLNTNTSQKGGGMRIHRRNSLLGSSTSSSTQQQQQGGSLNTTNNNNINGSSNHGAHPNVFRRIGSKRSFARRGSLKSATSFGESEEKRTDSSENLRRSSIVSSTSSSSHLRQGLINNDRRSARGLGSVRSSLGTRKSSKETSEGAAAGTASNNNSNSNRRSASGTTNSSNIFSTNRQFSRNSSSAGVAARRASTGSGINYLNSGSSSNNNNDLASKLHRIDRQSRISPGSHLTNSTGSKQIPTSLHLTICDGDESRTFVSTVTGESSLESHWSLAKERWKA